MLELVPEVLSIAGQMALLNNQIAEALLELVRKAVDLAYDLVLLV